MKKQVGQVTISLPGRIHPSINEWRGWSDERYNSEKKGWARDISLLAAGKRNLRWEQVVVKITYLAKAVPKDFDNYTPKLIMDALQVAGVIKSDTAKMAEVDWEFEVTSGDLLTMIQVTDVTERPPVPYLISCKKDRGIYPREHCCSCGDFLVFGRRGVYCRLEKERDE